MMTILENMNSIATVIEFFSSQTYKVIYSVYIILVRISMTDFMKGFVLDIVLQHGIVMLCEPERKDNSKWLSQA